VRARWGLVGDTGESWERVKWGSGSSGGGGGAEEARESGGGGGDEAAAAATRGPSGMWYAPGASAIAGAGFGPATEGTWEPPLLLLGLERTESGQQPPMVHAVVGRYDRGETQWDIEGAKKNSRKALNCDTEDSESMDQEHLYASLGITVILASYKRSYTPP